MHRILISAFAGLLLFPAFVHATDASSLPSRKAAVVLPLLQKISSKDDYPKIEQILGKPDMDIGSGIYVYVFRLDDSTSVMVGTSDPKSVFYIHRTGHGVDGEQVIYKKYKS
jgi:hypothetical protein